MPFGENLFKNPQKLKPTAFRRQLLPLVLLLVVCLLMFGLHPPWGGNDEEPDATDRPTQDDTAVGTAVDGVGVRPLERADPEPFIDKPEVLIQAGSRDRTAELDEEAIVYLFQKMRTGDEVQTAEPALSLEREDQVWEKLIEDPDLYRGHLVEIKGYVVSSEQGRYPLQLKGLEFPNPSGLDRCYQSYFLSTDAKLYLVNTFEKARELGHRDPVRLRAYFCQLYTNLVEYQGLTRATIPFVVGVDYVPFKGSTTSPDDIADQLYLLVLIGVPPAVIFTIVLVLRFRTLRALRGRRSRQADQGRRKEATSGGPPPYGKVSSSSVHDLAEDVDADGRDGENT